MQANITTRKKDNAYQVIVSYKDGRKWRQRSKQGFRTQRDAKEYGQKIIEDLKHIVTPIDSDLRDVTLREFAVIFFAEKTNLTYNTQTMYRNALKAVPGLLDIPLRQITHAQAVTAFNSLEYTSSTYNTYLRVLTLIANYAIRPYRIMAENPFKAIPRRKAEHKKIAVFTDDEIQTLLKSLDGKYKTMIAISYYTGLRLGEVLGLTWADINLDAKTLTVNKQFAMISNRTLGIKPPKSANGYRTIPMPGPLCDKLREYRTGNSTGRLFPAKSCKYIPAAIQRYVPGKTFHDLRHTYATKLLANGVDIKTVASLLGDHVNTVIGTYVHYTDEMRKKAAHDVDRIFNNNF